MPKIANLCAPRFDKILILYTERIGDAGDVVEVGDYLGGVVDGAIREAVAAQNVQIFGRHLELFFGDFGGMGTESAICIGDRSSTPIFYDSMNKRIGTLLIRC